MILRQEIKIWTRNQKCSHNHKHCSIEAKGLVSSGWCESPYILCGCDGVIVFRCVRSVSRWMWQSLWLLGAVVLRGHVCRPICGLGVVFGSHVCRLFCATWRGRQCRFWHWHDKLQTYYIRRHSQNVGRWLCNDIFRKYFSIVICPVPYFHPKHPLITEMHEAFINYACLVIIHIYRSLLINLQNDLNLSKREKSCVKY